MKIAIPKEVLEDEKRVAATPETIKKLIRAGLKVCVQKGAGEASSILDQDFIDAGANVIESAEALLQDADIVLKIRKPTDSEIDLYKEDAVLICLLQPLAAQETIAQLAQHNITSIAMEMVPRIARAQKLDALSSQSNVAGYKAVLMAANRLGKMMPMLMTAAGTITPARVLVLGAGVAGLQAIATAKRLGAIVEAFDVRPAVKDQVESLGAKFLKIDMGEATEDQGGYAKELSEESHQKEVALIASHSKQADIIITTALIPGKPSPKLISTQMVQDMKSGSVIVDLAAEGGGNCELTQKGQTVIQHGVTIIGDLNVPSLMAAQSSQLYARNVLNLLLDYYKEGKLILDEKDEIVKGALVTRGGQVVHPMLQARMTQGKGA